MGISPEYPMSPILRAISPGGKSASSFDLKQSPSIQSNFKFLGNLLANAPTLMLSCKDSKLEGRKIAA